MKRRVGLRSFAFVLVLLIVCMQCVTAFAQPAFLYDKAATGKPTASVTPRPSSTPKPSSQPSGTYGKTGKDAWKKGSIYGPSLSVKELGEVKAAATKAVKLVIKPNMNEYQKLEALATYLIKNCDYGSWSVNKGNTAWGALVKGSAACSGFARAYKALCDVAGLECYYVHAAKDAYNPEHQWNIVRCDGNYYIADIQLRDFVSEYYQIGLASQIWLEGSTNQKGGTYRYDLKNLPVVSKTSYRRL